jgi:CcmD family protein
MGYVIAAYAVVLVGFVGYALWLARRRAALAHDSEPS